MLTAISNETFQEISALIETKQFEAAENRIKQCLKLLGCNESQIYNLMSYAYEKAESCGQDQVLIIAIELLSAFSNKGSV